MSATLTREAFAGIVRDVLRLPLRHPDLTEHFDQTVDWRSIHRVRLFAALRDAGHPVDPPALFAATTVRDVYALAVGQEDGR